MSESVRADVRRALEDYASQLDIKGGADGVGVVSVAIFTAIFNEFNRVLEPFLNPLVAVVPSQMGQADMQALIEKMQNSVARAAMLDPEILSPTPLQWWACSNPACPGCGQARRQQTTCYTCGQQTETL